MTPEQFKRLRERKGYATRWQLSDAMLSNKTPCSVEGIRKWETGRRKISPFVEAAIRALPSIKK